MKITRIKIENFRSIKSQEFYCKNFNIFIGQNNSGKTNLFEAIEWFYTPKGDISKIQFGHDPSNIVLVEVEFSGAREGVQIMKHETNKTKIQKILNDNDVITFQRISTDTKKRKVFINNIEVDPGTGIDPALNDFLPRFEYVNTKQYFEAVAKYDKKTPIGVMLSGVLETILEGNEQYINFQGKFKELFEDEKSDIKIEFDRLGDKVKINLERQFPDCTKVKFEVTPPMFDDLLKRFDTTVDDGVETTAEEKGDGMQRALMLAIVQTYAEYRKTLDDIGKSFLFFIDEAELHLHPTAQRKLKNVLLELASEVDQVFINTHSSVFIADDHPKQSIFSVEKEDKETNIELVDDQQKPSIVFELLGGSPADLLLPKNFLIVEGKSELEFLNRIIKRFYKNKVNIQIIPAIGDIDQAERSINSIEKVYTALNNSIYGNCLVVFCDKPSEDKLKGVQVFLKRYQHLKQNGQIYLLPENSIEQYYPNHTGWKKNGTEVKKMSGRQKIYLAKRVAAGIT